MQKIVQITYNGQLVSLGEHMLALEGMKIRKDREQLFKNATFKKLMILSKKDPVLDFKSLIKQTKKANIKVVEFPDGHMSHVENETLFLHTIVHFIEKI